MQIGYSSNVTDRFIDYLSSIRVDSLFKDTWIVGLINRRGIKNPKDKTSTIDLDRYKSDNSYIREYNSLKIT